MTLSDTENKLMEVLLPLYGNREALLISEMVIEGITGWDRSVIKTMRHHELPIGADEKLEDCLAQLSRSVPIQYVLGYTWFYNLQLNVNEHVLIPRPETEELVDKIVKVGKTASRKLRILDLGTGSGCIPLGIKKGLPDSDVYGCDISEEALKVAQQNAKKHQLDVSFFKYDIRSGNALPMQLQFDIIVSNPPYIPFQESSSLHKNVVDHEPALALFVEDSDPFIFYKRIGELGSRYLKSGGMLFFEIHELMGTKIIQLLKQLGYADITLMKDMQGKDRMISAIWK